MKTTKAKKVVVKKVKVVSVKDATAKKGGKVVAGKAKVGFALLSKEARTRVSSRGGAVAADNRRKAARKVARDAKKAAA